MKKRTKGEKRRLTGQQAADELVRIYHERQFTRLFSNILIILCLALICGIALSWSTFSIVELRGEGMADTLIAGEYVLCEHGAVTNAVGDGALQRGMLILIDRTDDAGRYQIIRRIIGVPGDRVYMTMRGVVTLNGEQLMESYATYRDVDPSLDPGSGLITNPFADGTDQSDTVQPDDTAVTDPAYAEVEFPLIVPEGRLFVLADDRNTFSDSRSAAFGMIELDDVTGIVDAVVWPTHSFRLMRDVSDIALLNHLEGVFDYFGIGSRGEEAVPMPLQ